ncbi:hypothetical protein FHX37_1201 [Haloactinospora alba]|uniref:Uncharacterized protein n=1 Tax=Haloactinospora alba TaxID=405555 RepID=A0A543NHJ2_9ACTN|nr:membrane fusogenic activity family protein [Haloactinospora alba]TQN31301.1 hypothetical protein FHX37_1201 [Haloactinospora alba]
MVVDAVRAYVDAASGLTELTRKRAVAAAKTLLKERESHGTGGTDAAASEGEHPPSPPGVGQSIQTLANDLLETSKANRDALLRVVEAEVNRALSRADLVRRSDYDRLARRVAELERRMATQRFHQRSGEAPGAEPGADPNTASVEQPEQTSPETPVPELGSSSETARQTSEPREDVSEEETTTEHAQGTPEAGTDGERRAPEETLEEKPSENGDPASSGITDADTGKKPSNSQAGNKAKTGGAAGSRSASKAGNKRSGGRGKNAGSVSTAANTPAGNVTEPETARGNGARSEGRSGTNKRK